MICMIREVEIGELAECAEIIRDSFLTVADEFGFTVENASRFTAFSVTYEKLLEQFMDRNRQMFVFCEDGVNVGYYSLLLCGDHTCECNHLCVLPSYRHKGIGEKLLQHAFENAVKQDCRKINISIVEENQKLKSWYEKFGFASVRTEKFDFFPFTCGYMTKNL